MAKEISMLQRTEKGKEARQYFLQLDGDALRDFKITNPQIADNLKFALEGEALRKLRVENIDLQISPMTRSLYLWTRRGASRHSKMLGTEGNRKVKRMINKQRYLL